MNIQIYIYNMRAIGFENEVSPLCEKKKEVKAKNIVNELNTFSAAKN